MRQPPFRPPSTLSIQQHATPGAVVTCGRALCTAAHRALIFESRLVVRREHPRGVVSRNDEYGRSGTVASADHHKRAGWTDASSFCQSARVEVSSTGAQTLTGSGHAVAPRDVGDAGFLAVYRQECPLRRMRRRRSGSSRSR
jgi:hypothetical protein